MLSLFGVFFLCNFKFVYASAELRDFQTEHGICSFPKKAALENKVNNTQLDYSYVLNGTEIFKNRGHSRKTGMSIPPLTRLNCLYKSSSGGRSMMLITSAKESGAFCGWVSVDSLLETARKSDQSYDMDVSPCGIVKALPIKDFCSEAAKNFGFVEGCQKGSVKNSVIKTKFITDNTSKVYLEGSATSNELALYSSAQSPDKIGTVNIFTLLEVFDQEVNDETDRLRLLVGTKGTDLKGWVDYQSGTIWYSNLTAYFSAQGSKDVYNSEIGVRNNQVLARRPENLQRSLAGSYEFARFPVLFDHRARTDTTPPKIKPHLQIAFIGRYCVQNTPKVKKVPEGGDKVSSLQPEFCSDEIGTSQKRNETPGSDIMFLVDGTKSMQKYFSLVMKAVSELTKNFIDDPNYRFGVAMYGDFKSKSQTNTKDALDFKIIHKLQINFGDLFDSLDQTELFIADAMRDKEEATNAAIYNLVETTEWKDNRLKFSIHIGDHGDRIEPSDLVFDSLKSTRTFYIPVAVRGDGIIKASDSFVTHAKQIFEQHRTENGLPMALEPIVTYSQNIDEFEAIAMALVGSLNTGVEAANRSRSEFLGNFDGNSSESGTLPPGFAKLTKAAIELFFPKGSNDELKTVAAKGFIETKPIGESETNWDYFVALETEELLALNRSMETVCTAIGGSRDEKVIFRAIREMIETLTGDRLSAEELVGYWRDRNSIPLVSKTILGQGMEEFINGIDKKESLEKFKKSFCRSYQLTNLMLSNKKLPNPNDGASLKWNGKQYEYLDEEYHNWLYTDLFDRGYYYVPLNYLPTH